MLRVDEMDRFIKTYGSFYSQNPNEVINSNVIYSGLANYGLTPEEAMSRDITNQTNNLLNIFRQARHLNVFYSEKQPGFLQFQHWGKLNTKCVKLYLAVPKDYVEYVSYRVFDFIDRNRIQSLSKVAQNVRADGIVIRVATQEEASKVMNFVNSDRTLSSLTRSTNPFLMNVGSVGVSYDDNLSFNSCVSFILSKYYEVLSKNNQLGYASVESLANFVEQYHKDIFINCSGLLDFTSSREFQKNISRFQGDIGKAIANYEEIFRLFCDNLKMAVYHKYNDSRLFHLPGAEAKKTAEDLRRFYSFYNQCDDVVLNTRRAVQYQNIYNTLVNQLNQQAIQQEVQNHLVSGNEALNTLREYILFSYSKYGTSENVRNYLDSYLKGSPNAITRDNGFRDKLARLDRKYLISVIGNDTLGHINSILGLNIQQEVQSHLVSGNEAINTLNEYIIYALSKYGTIDVVRNYLESYLKGNPRAITRDNDFRDRFAKLDRNYLISVVGNDTLGYLTDTLNQIENVNKSSSSFDEYKTFYDVSYRTISSYGLKQLLVGLKNATRGDYSYLVDADMFKSKISPDEILKYCSVYLAELGIDVRSVDDIIVEFSTELDKQVKKQKQQQSQY